MLNLWRSQPRCHRHRLLLEISSRWLTRKRIRRRNGLHHHHHHQKSPKEDYGDDVVGAARDEDPSITKEHANEWLLMGNKRPDRRVAVFSNWIILLSLLNITFTVNRWAHFVARLKDIDDAARLNIKRVDVGGFHFAGIWTMASTGCANKKQSLRKNSLSQLLQQIFSPNLQLLQRRIPATYTANFVTIFAMV